MAGVRAKAPRLILVGVETPPDVETSGLPAGLRGHCQAALLRFADGPCLIAFCDDLEDLRARLADAPLTLGDEIASGDGAAMHILRSALAEPREIFAAAASDAERGGTAGPDLTALLDAALRVAARKTGGWALPKTDSASMVARLAENIHGGVAGLQALIVGGGGFSENIARRLIDDGLKDFTVISKRPGDAERLAVALGGHYAAADAADELLADADIVITDIGDGQLWISADAVTDALRRRRRKPILLVDGGIPGDVAPAVDHVEDAYLFSLDDLERMAMESLAGGADDAETDDAAIVEELARFRAQSGADDVAAVMSAIDARLTELAGRNGGRLRAWFRDRLRMLADDGGNLPAEMRAVLLRLFGDNPAGPGEAGEKEKKTNERL